ncbi:NADP-dependent oxidoreductase domain-containing protein [Dactylonectria macrodidyma]|uniref:NADP-dependent oxidoreductase domain-containing protein n=1 Tax=Dactylonectria macrodidyma TaxID=307937 RepID=A0A9P9IQM4_9HYPO|nr:NADP-dependent oxidoreductase domain-containing protein [Dactylonectria macrodidyma]
MAPPAQIPLRQLGKDGPQIPVIGFGLMGMSVGYGATDSDEERLKLLDRAWDLGCTSWDTADIYGDSEDVVGKWFQLHPERRGDIFLATKFGLKIGGGGILADSSPEHCRESIERSLKRLGVDQVDLYYMHRADEKVPIEKTVEVMKQIVEEGKAKYLGLSEVSSTTLRRANAVHPISAVQVEYNPWTLDIEGPSGTNLLDTCVELGVSIFAYAPLGRGILTGRFQSVDDFEEGDARRRMARFQGENFKKNLVVVEKCNELARRKECTSSQLVLAWLVAQNKNIFVIPGTKKAKYLEENVGASTVTLTREEQEELRKLVLDAGVEGGRDPTFGAFVDTIPLET